VPRPSHIPSFRTRAGLVVLAIVLGACAEPPMTGTPPPAPAEEEPRAEVSDPARDALLERVESLLVSVSGAREALARVADASDPATSTAAAQDALARLLHDRGGDGTVGLFPAESSERERDDQGDDALTAISTLAREAGGSLGREVVEVLRDPVAGDLGAWERDATGMLERSRAAVAGLEDVDDGIAAVGGLPGEGTRALAWTLLAAEHDDPDVVRAAAARASAHLAVVEVALGLLLERETPA